MSPKARLSVQKKPASLLQRQEKATHAESASGGQPSNRTNYLHRMIAKDEYMIGCLSCIVCQCCRSNCAWLTRAIRDLSNCTLVVVLLPSKPRKTKLDKYERQHNRLLAQLRVVAEHINRRLKIFRILALSLSQPPTTLWLTIQPDCSDPQL